jgi:PiT family inorganic phosphate transporter
MDFAVLMLIAFTLVLAAANGANDNIKGAATLLGSGVMGYRTAIVLATIATAAGGIVSIYLANGLLQAFSGKGIVPQDMTVSLPFLLSVAVAAAATVWIATLAGLPISTTHALLGGILGAGLAGAADAVLWGVLAKVMLLPLLLSPIIALSLSYVSAPLLRRLRHDGAQTAASDPCVCVDSAVLIAAGGTMALREASIVVGRSDAQQCAPAPGRSIRRFALAAWLDRAHWLSAAAVSFARGLNDTPKIAALLVASGSLSVLSGSLWVTVAMAAGGLIAAGRVANTLAFKVTRMDAGEGLGGNLVTAALVIAASRYGLPVSTTHVSTGALFGIAVANGSGRWAVIRTILLAWCFTLPTACVFAFLVAHVANFSH